ncbi:histone-like nucleoid-structuring protein Lsr2 [Curtobacterium flaccumfaciens pv. flaccumfaciens]
MTTLTRSARHSLTTSLPRGRSAAAPGVPAPGGAPKRGNSEELAKIREWARANGHEVSSRGRISQAVREAYDAAH